MAIPQPLDEELHQSPSDSTKIICHHSRVTRKEGMKACMYTDG